MEGLAYLERAPRGKPHPIYVVHGDEQFLKRHVLSTLRRNILGEEADEFAYTTLAGDKATLASVLDEVATLPFLGSRRLVVVEEADTFVSRERTRLEKYAEAPSATGILVLEVGSWPSNTRLAKALSSSSISCKAPASRVLPEWCIKWCAAEHGKQLATPAARLLVDLVGAEMGLLNQEMAKLALYVGDRGRIESSDVDRLVGNSREQNTWKIFDLIGAGQVKESLHLLDQLLTQGEEPLRLLGAFSMQMRRLAQAGRQATQGTSLADALERANVPPFARRGAEQQIRHLGRRRLNQVYDWLLQTDLGMKGSSQLPPRTLLEQLVVLLARKLTPDRLSSHG